MERIVLVSYQSFEDKESELEKLLLNHWAILNEEGLVSERRPVIAKASDSTYIEIFGWKSKEAIEEAHTNKKIQDLWLKFSKICNYIPANDIKEFNSLFSEFEPLN